MNFRSEINSLRALAVLAVTLFHFQIPGFGGGFIGVDIFFVISGYLMTSIILGKVTAKKFDLTEFYIARARRIIPALTFLCLSLVVVLALFLPPSEFMTLGKQSSASLTFLSNILFWQESGYFDSASEQKWLLHTWSLSVEWQFYILYPLCLISIRKLFLHTNLRWILLAFFLISLILAAALPARWFDAGFFLLPTRAWELLAGALVYFFPLYLTKHQSNLFAYGGLIILLGCITGIEQTNHWPNLSALLPILGACLIIYSHKKNGAIVTHPAIQYLGNISYSFYLWHWPSYVGLVYFELQNQPFWLLAGILFSVVMANISYRYIEQPFRKRKPNKIQKNNTPRLKAGVIYGLVWALVSISGTLIVVLDGMPQRLDKIIVLADKERLNKNPRQKECNVTVSNNPKSPECIFGEHQSDIGLIVIGDSHANATINAVAQATSMKGGVLYLGADGCTYMQQLTTSFFPACKEYNADIAELLKNKYPEIPVLVINRTTAAMLGPNENSKPSLSYIDGIASNSPEFTQLFESAYTQTLCALSQDRKTYILNPIPEMGIDVPQTLIKNKMSADHHNDISISLSDYYSRHATTLSLHQEVATHCGAKILDPTPFLCNREQCWGSINGRSLYYDDDHLSEYGNRLLVPLFASIASELDNN